MDKMKQTIMLACEGDWVTLAISEADKAQEIQDGTLHEVRGVDYLDGLPTFEADTFAQFERLSVLYPR
jgi:hypothetical protein